MRKTLLILVILLVAVSLFFGGCKSNPSYAPALAPPPASAPIPPPISGVLSSGHPQGMERLKWLTEEEKGKVIEASLSTPEAVAAKETYGTYKTMLGWVGIVWHGSHPAELWGLDYEMVDNIPDNVSETAEFYSRVDIYFGEPERVLLRVAVNPDTGEVANVETHGLKLLPPVSK